MYWLDTVLIIALGVGALLGAMSGLLTQLARVVGLVVALYAAFTFHAWPKAFLETHTEIQGPIADFLSYIVVFFGFYLAIFWITHLIRKAVRAAKLEPLDRTLGAVFGVGKMGLIAAVFLLGMSFLPFTSEMVKRSTVAPALVGCLRAVMAAVPSEQKDQLYDGWKAVQEKAVEQATKTVEEN